MLPLSLPTDVSVVSVILPIVYLNLMNQRASETTVGRLWYHANVLVYLYGQSDTGYSLNYIPYLVSLNQIRQVVDQLHFINDVV